MLSVGPQSKSTKIISLVNLGRLVLRSLGFGASGIVIGAIGAEQSMPIIY